FRLPRARARDSFSERPGMCSVTAMPPPQHGAIPDTRRPKGTAQQGYQRPDGVPTLRIPIPMGMWSTTTAPDGDSPAFALLRACVEPPAGIEPATPSFPWNHQEPLCEPPFPQVTPDRRGQSY